ncbi:DnaA/Hda family protein [Aldersonia sp. NBC_00410]|uniref:DnaA ATPase domain-containing protein n=1 Tax=Aldersonia sp. NBC_00410 TaxID=2975954 RepID=UPI00225A6DB8|nr:DnaA/Hda family protein [Aldersonia sp. NBC_00410]MCX5042439.1 DnaA/Hda family protein [Aldersonia sp. NBC_00410]
MPSSGALDPALTFRTFTISANNRFGHAAAAAVAESPGRAYNPLFLWGEPGAGKTHLLHALGHHAQHENSDVTVDYVDLAGLDGTELSSDADILLLDHIDMSDEAINAAVERVMLRRARARTQIVMASRDNPRGSLKESIQARCEWGLITDVG